MSKNYYMHLMDGKPAYYDKEDKAIYFINKYHKLQASDILCHSLGVLKRQQADYKNLGGWDLDYLRIPAGWGV